MDSVKIKKMLEKPIDVLFVTYKDYANTSYRFTKSLSLVGLRSYVVFSCPHHFQYPETGLFLPELKLVGKKPGYIPLKIIDPKNSVLNKLIKISKIIVWHSSCDVMNCEKPKDKTYILSCGGSTYRKNPKAVVGHFKNVAEMFMLCPDLLGRQKIHRETLVYYPVDIEKIKPTYQSHVPGKIIIGHFPSSPSVKGTPFIYEVIQELSKDNLYKDKFIYIGKRHENNNYFYKDPLGLVKENIIYKGKKCLKWVTVLSLMAKCDVYIETVNLTLDGKKYGEWGNTCLESGASGCIVLTNTLSENIYQKEYGTSLPFFITNNKNDLKNNLIKIFGMNNEEILNKKREIRKWVEDNHCFKKTGERLKNKIFGKYLQK
jgi:hypothetical protein